jgi:predicted AAA+ superfamily ATPase
MIPRHAQGLLMKLKKGYPVIGITGPRQSGKTTLARSSFPDKPYVSFEDPDTREMALADPRGFLARYADGAVFDEVQRVADLLSYLQRIVDENPAPGTYVLTGSQQFGLMSGVAQSLAGRIGMVTLLPFAFGELYPGPRRPKDLNEAMFTGLYPPVHDRRLDPQTWYSNYVQTYLERDVRQLVNVQDLAAFQRFVRLCAGRIGQLVNYSDLAVDCGVTHTTAKAWLSVLEASYLVFRMPPHHRNFSKRIIKTPRLHFYDTGLACWLLSIRDAGQLDVHPMRGHIFESWVVAELLKTRANQGLPPDLYFWQDRAGHEVDILLEQAGKLVPVEVKSGRTLSDDAFAGLARWMKLAGQTASSPSLVYGGDEASTHRGIRVVPWTDAADVLD